MGEAKRRRDARTTELTQAVGLDTAGGRVQVRWDHGAAATPFGQMVFFIEFLTLTGLLDRWIEACPLSYHSPNGSSKRDILGTWLLSILAGHRRYAHIAAIRADGVNPALLGMRAAVSEDTVRRALASMDDAAGMAWMRAHLEAPVLPLLDAPWILDVDVTVKPLYGHQEGAVLGYNPHKPGRPSHAYHSYLMAGMRLVLDLAVEPGNESHAKYSLPHLVQALDRLPADKRPRLVRGDCGYGADTVMRELETRGLSYLFKLRLTKNVRRYIEKVFFREDWSDAGQGWEGRDGELTLTGWQQARRVVLLRRPLKGEVMLADESQQQLAFVESQVPAQRYEYAVLVTDLRYELLSIAQLYRDRGDAENPFDELKNQWGWGGYTTHDLKRCRFAAMGVGLIYNWWSLFVRLANPQARLEAITSRPLLLSAVGRRIAHAGQQHLRITSLHADGRRAQAMLLRVSSMLQEWKRAAEQLPVKSVFQHVCEYLIATVTGLKWMEPPPLQVICA